MHDELGNRKASRRWVAVAVDVFNHKFFTGEPASRREAWLWMIAHAAWKDYSAHGVKLKRGDVAISRSFLAKTWGWTEKAVRYFLDHLRAENMIKFKGQQKGRKPSVASICNYEKFQHELQMQGPAKGPQNTPTQENISSTSSEAAREGLKDFDFLGGVVREPSPEARAAVCQQLGIANAEPLVAVYRRWKGARRAKDPDALFRKAAIRMFGRLTAAERELCKPFAPAMPQISVRPDARASAALLATLKPGSRYHA